MTINEKLTLTIAIIAVVVSVVTPFAQRKYEEWKARISFKLYLKKYLGVLFNILTYDKIEYHIPSIKDNPEKSNLTLPDYIKRFEQDFAENQNTVQYRIAFAILFNIQNLFSVINRTRIEIERIGVEKLYEHTLAYGTNLSKRNLGKIYGIFLLLEHYNSITTFHDRFKEIKSIKRITKDGIIIGFELDKNILKDQQMVAEDMKHLCNNELSIEEVLKINKLLIQEIKIFFDYEALQKEKKNQVNY
ncbi:hypothetical protein SAMN05192550_1529 [Flavobacterium glycines]|uniref:Uncharacterized protein n=1 Tax=Flavobacterium glycines TaxID=551990 RepID=A0A1B9DWH8_9FLAO|nr:hypothetical protein [Flavobacterium glycines]OCB74055.1 hypothetical protein FBGL_02595 [Flavobacterium glycines]GEL09470.1 hypothetical protein FGL01_02090 [Flavobacterium glycines]SDJ05621.1 hypothetical protein SAMN05192550_1529 [Flavobacterium glycines]